MELTSEVRALIFFGLLTAFLILERTFPRRTANPRRRLRWTANFGLAALNTVALWLVPVATVSMAIFAQSRGWGLLNVVALPAGLEVALAWLLLDGAIYWQHRMFHQVRALWPWHRVHHTDTEFDTSTALRFHPGEILLSVLFKSGVALALGASPLAVLLLETTVNGFALFNHANLRLRPWLETRLRKLIVTPDLHRVHHSVHRLETDSNYGPSLVLWDRLFGSYTDQPRDGHTGMLIGLAEFRDEPTQKLAALLAQPVK